MKKKGLGAWQLTMMALGSVIGGSFFLGSAVAINAAGPSILLGFIFGGALVYFILFAISEMTVANPSYGSFRTFAAEAFGKGTGFVVGWVYWTGMTLAMSSEATAVSILVKAWFPNVPTAALGSIIIVAVTLLNLLGASKLSKLESGLAALKLFAIISFIIIAITIIIGLFPGERAIGIGELTAEPLMPNGFTGLAGSMLIVMFTYAGFEVIGLAASEAENPHITIPKAIRNTVICLVALYITYIVVLLPLIPTADISAKMSPIVAAMNRQGITWAGTALNVVLISAILSTMLAAMFALGRMMRSLVDEGLAPGWLKDEGDVPYRGILASGFAMLISLGVGLLFPSAYLFLISSGGFAILFSYVMIMATHIRFRKRNGCPPNGQCQLWGFPYTSLFVLIALIASIVSMPFVSGQSSGLIAGSTVVVIFIICYMLLRVYNRREKPIRTTFYKKMDMATEISKELNDFKKNDHTDKH